MRSVTRYTKTFTVALAAAVLLLPHPSFAQDDEEVRQTVARIAFLSGSASFNRGDDPDAWDEAVVNFPMTLGDRLYTAKDGRVELQSPGARIFLGPETELAALELRDDVRQLSLTVGTASFRVNRLNDGEVFEVDTPNVAFTFRSAGYYRVDVDRDGNTFASVFKGAAVAAAAGGEVELQVGDAIRIDGLDEPRYDVVALPRSDPFDRWVEERSRRFRDGLSVQYASADVVGVDDLDREGEWQQIPDHGWVWSPPAAAEAFVPYRNGRWAWQDPWGWTWISYEPWGWAPYHYGSWVNWRDRWFWVPVPRSAASVRYAPARVVFTGDGPGASAGFVGWFPVGPRDRFIPWWGHRAVVTATGISFANQRFVTVVGRDAFVGGRFVGRELVRDQRIVRRAMEAPVVSGRLPFVPVPASIRVSGRVEGAPVVRPPRALESRAVVTRLAPPPAPPTFQTKIGLIQASGGMPVSPVRAEKLAVEAPRLKPIVAVRPVAPAGGEVLLAPKRQSGETRKVRPVAGEGRPSSTPPHPFAGQPSRQAPPRTDGGPVLRKDDRPFEAGAQPPRQAPPRTDGGPVLRKDDRPIESVKPPERQAPPRPDGGPVVRPEARPEPRSDFRREGKPEVKPEVKPEFKPEIKSETKPEGRPEFRPEARPEAVRPDSRPVPRSIDRTPAPPPERREPPARVETKPPDRPAPPPAPKIEPRPQPPQRVEKPPAPPKAEKPQKPEEKKDKEKDKKDR